MNLKHFFISALSFILLFSMVSPLFSVEVDISTCKMILDLFKEMKKGTDQKTIEKQLDAILTTRSYQTMFKHYNRDWRPNHLPPDVFRRLILSLQFPGIYKSGENQRADQMRPKWEKFYNDIPLFEKNISQLQSIDIDKFIDGAIKFAQNWLPKEMKVPDFYLTVHPNGGSGAFALPGAQGYDFFQLQRNSTGKINLQYFADVIAHESHHLGLNIPEVEFKNPNHALAFRFLEYFIGEGTATKFIDNLDGGRVPRVDPKRKPNTEREAMIKEAWEDYTKNYNKIWLRFFLTFEHLYNGEMTEEQMNEEFRNYWINGMIGRNYFLGSEIFGVLYHRLGKEACIEAMRNPRIMLPSYNKALDKKLPALNKCVRIPDSIVNISLSLGQN